MKKFTLAFFLFYILISVRLYSQPYGWFTQTSGTSNNLNSVHFANANTGIVVGQSGTIRRTTNGGTNWNSVTSGTTAHLFGAFFIDANTGWAAGDVGVILKTVNGGQTWSLQNSGLPYQLRSVSFRNNSTGYVAGWYGTFLRTTNGGTNWLAYSTGITSNLNSVSFADASVGFAVGQFGKIIKTSNGGVNWFEISSGTGMQLEQVVFINANTGTILGENGIVRKTTNSGTAWVTQSSGTGNWLNGITMNQQNFFVIVGDYGTVRKTSNGGTNWYQQTSSTGNQLAAVSFIDTNTGWAVGINGTIIKTTSGGWLLPGTASLSAPANNATCFSLTGTFDWSDVFPPISNYKLQVSLVSNFSTTVLDLSGINVSQYVLQSGQLNFNTQYYWRVKAVNQVGEGANWSSVRNFRTVTQMPVVPVLNSPANNSTTNLTPQLRWDSIPVAASYRCRVATDTGFTNVVLDSAGIPNRYINIPAGALQSNIRYYWRVTASNSCNTSPNSATWSFTTAMTGLTLNGTEIPSVYELHNNYPNPFNPVTTINFDLPKNSKVKLTVFDITGGFVTELVNNDLSAGKYSADWNAMNYASGVYLFRIEAYEQSQGSSYYINTKKMILVK
jgi:photosystem II stability/assembly factor-like uncharacterized protein